MDDEAVAMATKRIGIASPTTIKPADLVRTPSGRTATCIEIRPRGFRLLRDLVTDQLFIIHVDELYLVRSAKPKPWPGRLP